ncbi:MAG: hypothetical protein H7X79_04095, partial [Sporomusaceae bacterium]|nr:hypothetical protein [Sporomusaceae bacterium]
PVNTHKKPLQQALVPEAELKFQGQKKQQDIDYVEVQQSAYIKHHPTFQDG